MSSPDYSSSVRRDRKRKLERINARQQLRDTLPILNIDQIRKFRLPYHIAVMTELQEKGYANSAEFIRQLLQYQEDYRTEHYYDAAVQSRPQLVESKPELDRLYNTLKRAETAHYANDVATEIDELLTLASYYGLKTARDDWLWLADQLFVQTVNICYRTTDDFREAESLYLYGKYLIVHNMNEEGGMDYLNIAREMSGGYDWCASAVTKQMEKTIFVECCMLLYTVLTKQVKEILLYDPEGAFELCMVAKQRVLDACLPKADILFLQGRCEINVGKAANAVTTFGKAYNLYKVSNQIEKSCEARINLALAYLEIGNWERTNQELLSLLKFAEEHDLPNFVGQAYLYIGQYNLNQGTPEMATPTLVKAMHIFHELNDFRRREFVKNLAAVSTGQEFMGRYFTLILGCGEDKKDKLHNMGKLLYWKDLRVPFWEDMVESDDEVDALSDLILSDSSYTNTWVGEEGTATEWTNHVADDTATHMTNKSTEEHVLTDSVI